MKTTKRSVLYKVPKIRVRCISGHKCKPRVLFFLFSDLLQDELTKEEDYVSDVVYLCLAGLKQARNVVFLILCRCSRNILSC